MPVFVYSPENFLISNFIKPADLFHSSPYPNFKGFYGLLLLLHYGTWNKFSETANLKKKHSKAANLHQGS